MITSVLGLLANEEATLFFIRFMAIFLLCLGALCYLVLSNSTKVVVLALISVALILQQLGGWTWSCPAMILVAIFATVQVNGKKISANWMAMVAWFVSFPAIMIAALSANVVVIQADWSNLPNPYLVFGPSITHLIWVGVLVAFHLICRFFMRPKKVSPELNSRTE